MISYEQADHVIRRSKNLFELADNLEHFLTYISKMPNKKQALLELYRQMDAAASFNVLQAEVSTTSYNIFNMSDSIPMYLKSYWTFQETSKQNIQVLTDIIYGIRSKMLPPQSPSLSIDLIVSLLEHIEKRFAFLSRILKESPLQILCLNHSHVEWNSFYSARVYDNGTIKDNIMLLCPRQETDCANEFIFLHEMGHVLHTRLTKSLWTPPKSFRLVQERMFLDGLGASDKDASELFADCFAIASMFGSKFAKYNPYQFIDKEDNMFLMLYMAGLIKK